MRRLVLIVLLVPFLGPRLNKPGAIAPPPAAPPAFSLSGDVGTDARQSSVLLLPLTPRAEEFQLTDAAHGVRFDIDGDGTREMVAWPDGRSDVALLARDTNGDGAITSGRELIGSATDPDARNGCDALLALFRRTGAEPAGAIHAGHALYDQLLLWVDRNHNGRSDRGELIAVREPFTTIGMGFQSVRWADRHGNVIRFQGWMQARTAGPQQREAVERTDEMSRRRRYFEVVLTAADGTR
jgi:hypothetical protein